MLQVLLVLVVVMPMLLVLEGVAKQLVYVGSEMELMDVYVLKAAVLVVVPAVPTATAVDTVVLEH